MIRICAIDIGKVNFAFYVEDTDAIKLIHLEQKYAQLPKQLKNKVMRNSDPKIKRILDRVCKNGKRVAMRVEDLRADKTSNELDIPTRKNIIAYMVMFIELWKTCDIFVVEQQFCCVAKGMKTGINVMALKIAEIVATWVLEHFPDKEFVFFGAAFKTSLLGAPKLNKTQRKKWTVTKTIEIFTERGDTLALEQIETGSKNEEELEYRRQLMDQKKKKGVKKPKKQKQDDIADAVTMCQAFKYRFLVANF